MIVDGWIDGEVDRKKTEIQNIIRSHNAKKGLIPSLMPYHSSTCGKRLVLQMLELLLKELRVDTVRLIFKTAQMHTHRQAFLYGMQFPSVPLI